MKIGLDLHGVIDTNPKFWHEFTGLLVAHGHEIHILTGMHLQEDTEQELENMGIYYTHIFSIADYQKQLGTEICYDSKGNPHLDPYLWDKSKANYCKKLGIDLHIDDSDVYNYFFKTPYARYFSNDSKRKEKTKL